MTIHVTVAPTAGLRQVLRAFWPYAAPRRAGMAVVLLLAVVDPVLLAGEVWLFKLVVDDVLVPHDAGPFPLIALGYLALTLVQALVGAADRMLSTWLTQRFLIDVRTALLEHLSRLPQEFFARSRVGDLMSRVSDDVCAIESFLVSGSGRALRYSVEVAVFTVALFWIQPLLAAVSLLAAPLFLLASRHFSRRLKQFSREKQRRSGAMSGSVEQTLRLMPLVQTYHQGDREVRRYRTEAEAKYAAEMASARLRSVYSPALDLLELVGALAVIGTGVWLLSREALTVGELLAFLTFLGRLYGPTRGLGTTLTAAYSASAGAERVLELLAEPPMPPDDADAARMDRAVGRLTVRGVSYTYPGATTPALHEVDLTLTPGWVVAVVGESGAGKSTLVSLLQRSVDPDAGAVGLDGHDLRRLRRADLRAHVAVVHQRTLIVPGSVRDNITFGRPDATHTQVVAAARAADVHDVVSALPQGYDTLVGDRGERLSGGQAQRIAIARALLLDAPVLLLDEPTTGLDPASAHRVTEPLRRLMAGRATLVVTHRLHSAAEADEVVVLHGGRVVERGGHADLLSRGGRYAAMWAAERRSAPMPSGAGR